MRENEVATPTDLLHPAPPMALCWLPFLSARARARAHTKGDHVLEMRRPRASALAS